MGASSSSSMIHLRTGSIDAVNEKTAVKPAGTWAHTEQKQNTSPTTRDLYLITFTHPIAQEARDRVTSLIEPVKLENYIPDNTFLVYITHQQAGAIASAAHENSPSGIVAVIPLAKIHRVQPNLVKSLEKQDSDMASLNVLLATTYPARTDEETTARAAAIQHALHSVDQNATATMMSHDKIKVTTNKKTAAAVADHLSGMHDVQWIEAVPVHKLQPAASVGHGHGPKLTL